MQKSWISIGPKELWPEVTIPVTPIKHNRRIYIENLQEDGGWHYNLIVYPEDGYEPLTESQAQENLDVELPDGRSFRRLFWPADERKVLTKPWANENNLQKQTQAETVKSGKYGEVKVHSKVDEMLPWTKVQKKKRSLRIKPKTPKQTTQCHKYLRALDRKKTFCQKIKPGRKQKHRSKIVSKTVQANLKRMWRNRQLQRT